MREGLLDPKMIGKAMMDAQRGGPPSFRPLFKANYGRLLTDPESLGFKVKKDKDGKMLKDALGAPMFTDPFVSHSVREVPEKLSAQDITNKILGDTIDKGKAGGTEFMEFGGEIVIKHVLSQRGGDLVGQLMRRPESIEGRSEMSASINRLIEAKDGAFDKTTLESLYRYFTSSGARSAGLGLDIIEGIAVSDEGETIPRINLNDFLRQYIATTPSSSTSETSSDAHPESDSGGSNTPQGP
jgi:hypothetical protein